MILRAVTAVAAMALATFVVAPAQADVLEIGSDGEARWISGPNVLQIESTDFAAQGAAPLAEIPAEAAVFPDYAVADTARAEAAFQAAVNSDTRYELELADGTWADSRHAAQRALASLQRSAQLASLND